ncbi:MAG: hypothetical protein ACREA9_25770 [Pyrinomonadaceae bacterium]
MYFCAAEKHCGDVAKSVKEPGHPSENMKTNSQHIPFARLADLAENRASAEERTASMTHVSACSDCAAELQRLGRVLELMRTDTAPDAPRDLLAFARAIFRRPEGSSEPSLLRRIVAALTFDSSMNLTPAFGVRSGQSASRQLLYSAEGSDIDLRISSQKDQWIVAGQLLGPGCAGGQVEIEGEGQAATAALNDICEFTLPPLPSGSYMLRLRLRDTQVEIPRLELRA